MSRPDIKKPSNMEFSVLITLYIFASTAAVLSMAFILSSKNIQVEEYMSKIPEFIMFVQAVLTIAIAYYLLRKYRDYLLGDNWNIEIVKFFKIGLKWAMPLVAIHVLHGILLIARPEEIKALALQEIVKNFSDFGFLAFIFYTMSASVLEEVIFRGILLRNLLLLFKRKIFCILLSSTVFSLFHFITQPFSLLLFLWYMLVGFLCGFAFTTTRSIISAIVPHFISNLFWVIVLSAGWDWSR
jgi:membrane protease YdiL (CAAX protease family)